MNSSFADNFTIRGSLKVGIPALVVQALAAALASHSFLLPDRLHVGSGLAWTGKGLWQWPARACVVNMPLV
ncbi:MAG: hypothetical protein JRN19_02980 [Nitrososphaerota archaeon]|nr:hypothetical protein [Nitrososphaerota archaeon]MDG7051397.1 hypothetical protein [Nitrososphaerota archaeon]